MAYANFGKVTDSPYGAVGASAIEQKQRRAQADVTDFRIPHKETARQTARLTIAGQGKGGAEGTPPRLTARTALRGR